LQFDRQPERTCAAGQEIAVAKADQIALELPPCDGEAEVRPDARRLARGQRDSRQHGGPAADQPLRTFT
jgi:hypothetical protein